MPLPYVVENLDNLPESARTFYVERDGKHYLEVDGAKPIEDFTALETALKKRLADATAKLEAAQASGITRDEIREMARELATELNAGNGGGGDKGGNGADARHVADLERQLAAAKDAAEKFKGEAEAAAAKVTDLTLGGAMASAASASGVRAESADTLARIARTEFEISETGQVRSKVDSEFGPDLTPDQVFEKMKLDPRYAPFWPGSRSGGAGGGNDRGGAGGGDNPWTAAKWNLTAQAQVVRADPEKAKRLAAEAGSKIGATKPPKAA